LQLLKFQPSYVGPMVQHTSPHRTSRTYTKRYAAASPQLTFYIFKFSDLTRHLRIPWRWYE